MKNAPCFVYFIKPVDADGPIKVGCSTFPPARLAALQTWSPVDLEIISHFEGSKEIERAIHERFAQWQVRGEWFEPVKALTDLAYGIRDGGKLDDLVDLSAVTGKLFRRPNAKSEQAKIVGSFKRRVDAARLYASGVSGRNVVLPGHVASILNSAGGYRQEYRDLTEAEMQTLEGFIRDCRGGEKGKAA